MLVDVVQLERQRTLLEPGQSAVGQVVVGVLGHGTPWLALGALARGDNNDEQGGELAPEAEDHPANEQDVLKSAEAGVLGIPFIRYNDFVGKIGYLADLEDNYELGTGIKPGDHQDIEAATLSIIKNVESKSEFQKKIKGNYSILIKAFQIQERMMKKDRA